MSDDSGERDEVKIGDVKALRSGGPAMTVIRLLDDECVECTWFSKEVLKKATFPLACLVDGEALKTFDERVAEWEIAKYEREEPS